MADDEGVKELTELRADLVDAPSSHLRIILLVARIQRAVRPSMRRDEGWNQRVSLVRQMVRERARK